MGLVAAFIGAGSGAVCAWVSTMITASDQFNLQNPGKLLQNMAVMFVFSGLLAFFAKLHTQPIPSVVVTTTETTTMQKSPPALVTKTVTETVEKPTEPDR